MWKLIVIWNDSSKNEYEYKTQKEANDAGLGFEKAFGQQVEWWGIIKKRYN